MGATLPTPDPEAWEFSASLIGLTLGNHGSAPEPIFTTSWGMSD